MRWMQHRIVSARAALRNLAARRAPRASALLRPARLVLRLDPSGLAGAADPGPAPPLAVLQRRVAEAVRWLGPVPVTVLAHARGADPITIEIIRFAHRLDCPTRLETNGDGIDRAAALALVDAGLRAVVVRVGGIHPATHAAVTQGDLAAAQLAARSLVGARRDRGAALDLEIAIPWRGPAASEARAVAEWARQAGADGVRVEAPYRASQVGDPAHDGALDALLAVPAPFGRTPSATGEELRRMAIAADGGPGLPRTRAGHRRLSRCPIGGQRLELGAEGQLVCCPFHPPIPLGSAALADAWRGADPHLAAIRACDRACAHVELAPAPLLSKSPRGS